MNDFKGKVAFITGGGSGMGADTAILLARFGAKVVIAGRTISKLENVVENILETGGEASYIQCDVSDYEQVKQAVKFTVDKYGRLDYAVNNAGVNQMFVPTEELSVEEFQRVISINFNSIFYSMKEELKVMKNQGSGSIVNVSSVYGKKGMMYNLAYSGGKHGIHGMTKAAALEVAEIGVRVNTLLPGVIQTPLLGTEPEIVEEYTKNIPMKRVGTGMEIAQTIMFLLSDNSSYITGTEIVVDGGYLAV